MIEANPGLLYEMGVRFHHIVGSQIDRAIQNRIKEANEFTPGGIGDKSKRRNAQAAIEEAALAIRRAAGAHNRVGDELKTGVEELERFKREAESALVNPVLAARAGAYGTTANDMVAAALQEHEMRVQQAYRGVVETNEALLPELQEKHPVPPAI